MTVASAKDFDPMKWEGLVYKQIRILVLITVNCCNQKIWRLRHSISLLELLFIKILFQQFLIMACTVASFILLQH